MNDRDDDPDTVSAWVAILSVVVIGLSVLACLLLTLRF